MTPTLLSPIVLSAILQTVAIACNDSNEKKRNGSAAKDPAKQQKIEEQQKSIIGFWQVASTSGGDEGKNILTAGTALGVKDSKPIIQFSITKEKVKISHHDGDLTYWSQEFNYKMEENSMV